VVEDEIGLQVEEEEVRLEVEEMVEQEVLKVLGVRL
jgi:hypothetical protein